VARHTSGSGSGVFVSVLTALALAVVGFFAYQASAAIDGPVRGAPPSDSASPGGGADGGREPAPSEGPPGVPAESGQGKRVIYSLSLQRVWLVDLSPDGTGEIIADTYEVFPSSASPPVGQYTVTQRFGQGTGSDGVAIEHSVVFHTAADGVVFGFSAALDGSTPDPDAELRTGGIRQTRADGDAMWLFATADVPVIVMP
jgi:hypothetical protein